MDPLTVSTANVSWVEGKQILKEYRTKGSIYLVYIRQVFKGCAARAC